MTVKDLIEKLSQFDPNMEVELKTEANSAFDVFDPLEVVEDKGDVLIIGI